MTKQEFEEAMAGFDSKPERHFLIDGRVCNSKEELIAMAEKSGIKEETVAELVQTSAPAANLADDKPKASVVDKPKPAAAKPNPSKPKAEAVNPAAKPNPSKPKAEAVKPAAKPNPSKPKAEAVKPAAKIVAIPEPALTVPVVSPAVVAPEGVPAATEPVVPPLPNEVPAPAEPTVPPAGPVNLLTLSWSDLKALAAQLGVSPVPTTQGDLIAAISAKQAEGS